MRRIVAEHLAEERGVGARPAAHRPAAQQAGRKLAIGIVQESSEALGESLHRRVGDHRLDPQNAQPLVTGITQSFAVALMPMSDVSPIAQPCSMTWCPTDTLSPMTSGTCQ